MKRMRSTRRQFLGSAAVAAAPFAVPEILVPRRRVAPIAIASGNGFEAVKLAVEKMTAGVRPVDAAVAGVSLVEADPNDPSVGYGGIPNAEGVVELDASVMDGPTHLAGAVASLRNIMHPSQVALQVMRRTDHILLVGRGALAFAKAHGFREENLLTERAREAWLRWREHLSPDDAYVEEGGNELPAAGAGKDKKEDEEPLEHGTIHLSALDTSGNLGACTTTSGLSFKIPGRVGDSPLIGCGLFVDNDVGAAGSTGRGEAAILSNGSHSVVENMRRGMTPVDACLELLRRIVHYARIPRLRTPEGRPTFNISFYALNKNGDYGAASLYPGRFVVCTPDGPQRRETTPLFERR